MQPTPPPPLPVTAKGRNGDVHFDGHTITITRQGFIARAQVGAGQKQIPIGQVTAVQFKPYSVFGRGFIQFTIPGGNEIRSRSGHQARDSAHDENTVQFNSLQEKDFQRLRDAINYALSLRNQVPQQPAWTPPPMQPQPQVSVADELSKLHSLVQAGALSPAEFEQAKARLLGGG